MKTIYLLLLTFFIGLVLPSSGSLPIAFSPKKSLSINNGELSITTLNTWGLPIWYGESTSAKRYDDLLLAINNSNSQIICLQEVFNKKLRRKMETELDTSFNHLTDLTCDRKVKGILTMDCYGGLVTLSKFPIISESFFPFPIKNNCSIIESTGRKGFLLTTLSIEGKYVNVLNSHLYAGSDDNSEKQRMSQVKYMDSLLKNMTVYKNYPTILSGDLNVQHPYVSKINKEQESQIFHLLCKLGWYDVRKDNTTNAFTYDPDNNVYASKDDKHQILDYIMWNDPHNMFNLISEQVLFKNDESVSDHNGYNVIFKILPYTYDAASNDAIVSK